MKVFIINSWCIILFLFAQIAVVGQAINVIPSGYITHTYDSVTRPIGLATSSDGSLVIANVHTPPRTLTRMSFNNNQVLIDTIIITFNANDHRPEFIAIDSLDNVYFARPDFNDGDLYRLKTNGQVETIHIASSNEFYDPRGLVFDSYGNLWVTNNVHPDGNGYVSKYSFNTTGSIINNVVGIIDSLVGNVMGLQFDDVGNLFIANDKHICKVTFDNSGNINGINREWAEIPTNYVQGAFCGGIAIDQDGDLFVSHFLLNNPDSGKIYRVSDSGTVELFADGMNQPRDMVFGTDNKLYITEFLGYKLYVVECDIELRQESNSFCKPRDEPSNIQDLGFESVSPSIYPNPGENNIHITLNESRLKSVSFYDCQGKLVMFNTEAFLDVSYLNSGLYLVVIEDDIGGVHKKRFVKH